MIGLATALRTTALFAFAFGVRTGVLAAKAVTKQDSFPYLYATRSNHSASFPVIEYIAPSEKGKLNDDEPDFLYNTNQPARIVNFYGHWCNTCKNFKPHYVHFARKVKQLADRHNETLKVYAISCHPNRKLCRKQTAQGYPLIRLLKPGHTTGIDLKHTEINPVRVLQKLGVKMDIKEEEGDWDMSSTADDGGSGQLGFLEQASVAIFGKEKAEKSEMYLPRSREDLKNDIHQSFDYVMRNSIFASDDPLTKDASEALKNWFILLSKTLPINWEIHKLLDAVLKDFNYISKHEAYLIAALDQYPPLTKGWSNSCSRGVPDEGFTCGLWELFHAMTVGLVDYNNMVHEKRRISTEKAAHSLRDFIENFFQCLECRANFLKAYDSCSHNRCRRLSTDVDGLARDKISSWAQLPLWLFETHNGVNVRLMKEKATRENRQTTLEDEIGVLWPPPADCLPCWNTDKSTGSLTPNPTVVYKWLQLEYGQRDENTQQLRQELKELHVAAKRRLKHEKVKITLTQSSLAAGLIVATLMSSRLRRRRATGLHKKFEGGRPITADRRKIIPGSKRNLAA